MSQSIRVSILAPEAPEFTAVARSVTLTSSSGPLTIMRNHARYACPVCPGPLLIDGAVVATIKDGPGFAYVHKNHVVMILSGMPPLTPHTLD